MKSPHISDHPLNEVFSKIPKGTPIFPGGSCVTARLLVRTQEPIKNDAETIRGTFESLGVHTGRFPINTKNKIGRPFKDK